MLGLDGIEHCGPCCAVVLAAFLIGVCGVARGASREGELDGLAVLKPGAKTGFSHGGWNVDRYPELETLRAGAKMTVADLEGPGIIRYIHTTRHAPKELFARGVVLEIWFDAAETPAVVCPLADFFGDGCNGNAMDFSSNLIECAPWSYNCYFPMPFKERARVILRNDTDRNATDYSLVEWEPIPAWNDAYGYFHATYQRKAFRLAKDTDETFFEIDGTGQVVGRQFSIVTDEPIFKDFAYVMEGNNEVDIDGRERALDYLGSEDSFGFSWGFQRIFVGLRSGMTLVDTTGACNLLSIYRFHDHMPIRFTTKLRWHINWGCERHVHQNPIWVKRHNTALDRGGCWVDYATVHYWYQDQPGGFEHEHLPPVEERQKVVLHPNPADNGPKADE